MGVSNRKKALIDFLCKLTIQSTFSFSNTFMSTNNEPDELPPVPCPLGNNTTPLSTGKLRVTTSIESACVWFSYSSKQ